MSGRALLALVIGVLLAIAGLALLVWLLWKLWTSSEREKEPPIVELELEPQPALEPSHTQEPPRISPASEEVLPVPPAMGEPEVVPPPPVDVIVEEPAAQAPLPGAADDLKLIEGIGPKIASVLREAGIDTFARLAATDVDRLEAILQEADPRLMRLADPGTWPEQAGLAAVGEWDALTELQGRLKGGRRS